MKRVFISIILILIVSSVASAQISNFGFRIGAGLSTVTDDLTHRTPILGATVGGYATISFAKRHNVLSQILTLQVGLNLTRRGGNFSESFTIDEGLTTERLGSYKAYYLQLPILANFRFQLPNLRTSYACFFVGPAVSYGLMGQYNDREVTPYMPQRDINYVIKDAAAFDYMNRLDIEAIIGFGVENGPFTASIYADCGFMALIDEPDAVKSIEENKVVNHAGGSCTSYMVAFGYRIPCNISKRR